ncbi:MAG: zinc ribbon domain-containing protein YjdM [Fusobacteriaceae bacterium]
MSNLSNCPQCKSEYTYEDRGMLVCPECANEWNNEIEKEETKEKITKDSCGSVLINGDSVTVIKDLKVKGSSLVIKCGTKIKNVRIIEGDHDIACKIDGIGAMNLKSEFLKKI